MILTILACTPPSLAAQGNVNVPPDDLAYERLETLGAFGLLATDIAGTKPFSRTEFARLILEGEKAYAEVPVDRRSQLVESALDYLTGRFADDLVALAGTSSRPVQARLIENVRLSYVNYRGEARAFGTANLDAELQPFTAYREGRKFREGQNAALESRHWFAVGRTLGLYYQGRVIGTDPRSRTGLDSDLDFETLRFYVKATTGNVDLLLGKDGMVWGMGRRGNLMLSNNARPIGSFNTLPLIKLSNTRPVRLPWIFGGLGPMRYTLFASRLEEDRSDQPRPYFVGVRLDFKTSRNSEFGVSHSYILASDSVSLLDAIGEFFFIRAKENFFLSFGGGGGQNIANHILGFDFKIRFPGLRYSEFFSEFYFDDLFRPSKLFKRDLAFHSGIYVPRLTPDGRLGLRLEFTHTSTIFYTGTQPLEAGFVRKRRILGNNLGPFGNEIYGELEYRRGETVWSGFANAQYRGVGVNGRRTPGSPGEKRYRIGGKLATGLRSGARLQLEAGYTRTLDFDNVAGDNRNEFLFGAEIQLDDPVRLGDF